VTGEDRGKRLAGGEDGRIGRAGSATGRREWAQGVLVLVVSATIVRRVMKILAWFRNGGGIEGRRALGAGEEGRSRRREAEGGGGAKPRKGVVEAVRGEGHDEERDRLETRREYSTSAQQQDALREASANELTGGKANEANPGAEG
jgi:hypothetical protein